MLATAASGQAKHHPVYPGTRTARGAIWDRLGGAWRLTEDALLKSESLRFTAHATSHLWPKIPISVHILGKSYKLTTAYLNN